VRESTEGETDIEREGVHRCVFVDNMCFNSKLKGFFCNVPQPESSGRLNLHVSWWCKQVFATARTRRQRILSTKGFGLGFKPYTLNPKP
jgi:hypothetical protein